MTTTKIISPYATTIAELATALELPSDTPPSAVADALLSRESELRRVGGGHARIEVADRDNAANRLIGAIVRTKK